MLLVSPRPPWKEMKFTKFLPKIKNFIPKLVGEMIRDDPRLPDLNISISPNKIFKAFGKSLMSLQDFNYLGEILSKFAKRPNNVILFLARHLRFEFCYRHENR